MAQRKTQRVDRNSSFFSSREIKQVHMTALQDAFYISKLVLLFYTASAYRNGFIVSYKARSFWLIMPSSLFYCP